MKFTVEVYVSPRKDILDPQGKAIESALANLAFTNINHVRVGKYLTFIIDADNPDSARIVSVEACEKLLTNPIIEDYRLNITQA
jgi:phosphoribosylformylglycinamidine synthase subunit PurS